MRKIGLPSKGRLLRPTLDLLDACGYSTRKDDRSLTFADTEHGIEYFFLRSPDLPTYIAGGTLDAAVCGKDDVAESGRELACLIDLNFGHCALHAAVPSDSSINSLEEVAEHRIATSYTELVRGFFAGRPLDLVELSGAVEISVRLGIADAVIDFVETGQTLREAGLRVVGPPLFSSNAGLFVRPDEAIPHEVAVLKRRLEGRMLADEYVMVEYDAPLQLLDQACAITPGIESPTISPLQDPKWRSIRAMVLKSQAHRVMDELDDLGCEGIVLTKIENARISKST